MINDLEDKGKRFNVTVKVFANNKVSKVSYSSINNLGNVFYNAYTKLLVDNKNIDIRHLIIEITDTDDNVRSTERNSDHVEVF